MQHDAWFFVGVFAFIFLVWVATGGPTHPLSYSGPLLAQPGALGGGTYLSLPRSGFGIGTNDVTLPDIGTGQSTLSTDASFGSPSSYRGMVSMNEYVYNPGATDPNTEYIQLSLSRSATIPVTISGWVLESTISGNASRIPLGVYVPVSGAVNTSAPITLRPGDTAILTSGSSPVGFSFSENLCTGYFGQFQTFSPNLTKTCPTPYTELQISDPYYKNDYDCISYVENLSRCTAVTGSPTHFSGTCNSYDPNYESCLAAQRNNVSLSGACTNFLSHYLNYNSCVSTHQGGSDFQGHSWRIYLGRSLPLWSHAHDSVKLLDAEGKTVDAFSY